MQRPADTQPPSSPPLQEVYGEGYFHGANSGFAKEGYAEIHATWQHWMPWIRQELGAGARLLDLGCAFGFLIEEARAAGLSAFGLDASRYALSQVAAHAGAATGTVVLGNALRLPFADRTFDVVTAFDLLEHVPTPEGLLREAARILRPGGLFIAATPDPLLFDREEPTHVAEHVPSWWVHELERAGFAVALRFFQAEYNCELVARRDGPAPQISFDALAADPVIETAGDPALRVAPRCGVGRVEADATRVIENGSGFYLLNTGRTPLAVDIKMEVSEAADLGLSLDGRVVLRSLGPVSRIAARVVLPIGGHRLRISIEEGWARLTSMRCAAEAADSEGLCRTLPFDLYERYALTAEVLRRVGASGGTLLDVGGTMGGEAGHLAWTGDFLPGHRVTVVDTRLADLPAHRAVAPGDVLPFADRAFDTVSAQDVLEHVPAAERPRWLEEVWRVTDHVLLLGAPWATPGVAEADRYLFELIRQRYGYEHGFLAEHLSHGHPDLEATREFFLERGASVMVLPSGYLPAWILMQTVNAWLSHPEQDQSFALANETFNRAVGLAAVAAPAYRHLLVIDRQGRDLSRSLGELIAPRGPDLEAVQGALSALAAGSAGGAR